MDITWRQGRKRRKSGDMRMERFLPTLELEFKSLLQSEKRDYSTISSIAMKATDITLIFFLFIDILNLGDSFIYVSVYFAHIFLCALHECLAPMEI